MDEIVKCILSANDVKSGDNVPHPKEYQLVFIEAIRRVTHMDQLSKLCFDYDTAHPNELSVDAVMALLRYKHSLIHDEDEDD